jgi:hypothetical protein
LKVYPSEPESSIAIEMNGSGAPATTAVTSTSIHTPVVRPGSNVVSVAPVGGRLLKLREVSVQLLSATWLMFWTLAEPLEMNILSVAN